MPLKEFQVPIAESCFRAMEKHRFFVNACTTGSGKTFVSCDVMNRRQRPALVVSPKAALTQWKRVAAQMEASRWLLDVINPEQISKPSGCTWYTRDRLWKLPPGTDVYFDEIHRSCGGIKSQTGLAVAQLKAFGTALCAMSATVACDPLHLRSLGYWAGFHQYNKDSFYSWCRMNGCKDVEVGFGPGCAGRSAFMFTKNRAESRRIMAALRQSFGERMLALGPDEIPGFPSQTMSIKLVDLSKRDREEVNAAYAARSERIKAKGKSQMAELGKERQRVEFVMADALAELSANAVEDGYSAVTVMNYTEPRERTVEALKARGVTNVSEIYGTDSAGRPQKDEDRDRNKDLFQENVNPAIVLNCEAGGVALSLHDERHERMRVSYIVPSYNASSVRQALGRIRRVDGTHAAQNLVIAAGTVMERVAAALERKLANMDALLDEDLIPNL